jgi:hypothetical protein
MSHGPFTLLFDVRHHILIFGVRLLIFVVRLGRRPPIIRKKGEIEKTLPAGWGDWLHSEFRIPNSEFGPIGILDPEEQ